jgi:hypothetical protein
MRTELASKVNFTKISGMEEECINFLAESTTMAGGYMI